MSTQHTPGKLMLNTTYAEPELRGEGGELISISMPHRVADARRLAACWNACDGISTESLVSGTDLITAFQREQDRADTAERHADDLRAMNAELVDALKGVVRVADRATDEFDAASAAIAKATGKKGSA